jgi:hypothetical protein
VSSSSAITEVVAYLRERVLGSRVLLLAVSIAALACLAETPRDGRDLLLRGMLAALLVVTFRLWDDLADLPHDRRQYPQRVLARSTALRWFWSLLLALALLCAGALAELGGMPALLLYTGLCLMLAAVYYAPWLRQRRFARNQLVLLKYPLFIALLCSRNFSGLAAWCGTLAYLFVSAFDWYDDPALRGKYRGWRVVVVLMAGLVLAVSLVTAHG